MVEERRHRARPMMRQRGELLDEGRVGRRVGREVPRRVVEDGAVAFLATQRRDVLERGVHCVTLGVVQRQPGRRYQPSEARPSTPLEVPPNIGLSRRCASTPRSKFRLSRSSTPRP